MKRTILSLGRWCLSASLLKDCKLKTESYPFDWIHSSPKIIEECLLDDFRLFISPEHYINYGNEVRISSRSCGHSLFGPIMFPHHDLRKEEDYNYFLRCIQRFETKIYDNETCFIYCCIEGNKEDSLVILSSIVAGRPLLILEINTKKDPSIEKKKDENITILHISYNGDFPSIKFPSDIHFQVLDEIQEWFFDQN